MVSCFDDFIDYRVFAALLSLELEFINFFQILDLRPSATQTIQRTSIKLFLPRLKKLDKLKRKTLIESFKNFLKKDKEFVPDVLYPKTRALSPSPLHFTALSSKLTGSKGTKDIDFEQYTPLRANYLSRSLKKKSVIFRNGKIDESNVKQIDEIELAKLLVSCFVMKKFFNCTWDEKFR